MKYHITGVFLLEDPAAAPTEVFTAALNGDVDLDAVIVVTDTAPDPAVQENLDRLMAQSGVTPRHVVRDQQRSLAAQLTDALAHDSPQEGDDSPPADAESWLWFVTEHGVVAPDSLAQQLQTVEVSPSVAVAGAKQLVDRRLVNVGLTVGADGHIVSLIEPGELDQGQYDHRTDVFAVSTPGMLIKTALFTQLDGFDHRTPQTAQTVDLCWRARLAGHRVAVVPGAEVQHNTMPEPPAVTARWEQARWLRLKHTGFLGMVGGWIWGAISAVGVILAGLIFKTPRTGVAQARGILRTLRRPAALLASRKHARKTRARRFDVVAELRPSRARVRDFRRSVVETRASDRVIGDGTGVTTTPQEATGGHDDFDELATPDRNWVGIGAVTLAIVFGAVALLGLRHLLGAPALAGGNLLPVSDQLSALATKAMSGWAHAGAGAPGYDGPFGWLLALFGLTTNASAVTVWLWVLALPLAGLGAWALAGAITTSRYIRFAAGLSWAAAPVLFIAVSEGRLGGLIVHLVLPWLGLAVLRAIGYSATAHAGSPRSGDTEHVAGQQAPSGVNPRRRRMAAPSLTAAAWVAILLTVITAAAPAMFIAVTAVLVILMVVWRATAKMLWWTPLLGAASLVPAIVTHGTDLRAIFADPGAPAGFDPAPTWQFLLGLPHNTPLDAGVAELPWLNTLSPDLPWTGIAVFLIAAPVLILSLIGALLPGRGGTLARASLVVSFVGLAMATAHAGLIFAIDQTGTAVPLSTIPPVSLAWLGFLVAAIQGLHALTTRRPIDRAATSSTTTAPTAFEHTGSQHAGWPVRTATSVLVVVGVITTGMWLTPRMVPTETLTQARDTALEQRSLAATEAAVDEQVEDDSTRASLHSVTGTPAVSAVLQRALPATAVDSARSELQTRTVVITRTSEGIRTHLVTGQGTMLDDMTGTWTTRSVTGELWDPQPAPADDADSALRTVAAQLTSGADTDPRQTLDALGAGYVVLTDPSGTETSLAAGIDAAPGMAPVGHTPAGWLWRVVPDEQTDDETTHRGVEIITDQGATPPRGTASARARIVEDNQTQALVASNPDGTIDVELPAATAPRQLVLAERTNPGFRAVLDGEELEATVVDPEWVQAFELPETGGQLTVEYAPPAGSWLWLIPGIIGIITLLLAIPTPARVTSGRVDEQR